MGLNPHGHCSFENEQKLFKNRYKPRIPCKFNHGLANERPSALVELYKMLGSAQESICICIMMIKLKEMIQFLRYMKLEKNIKIQVIINTKCKQEFSSKKEMKILQDAGVEVKTNHQGMVHNKFVIVDRKTLISGSINWTYVAFNNNDETIMFTSQWAIVDKFLSKFDQMWEQMSPLTSNTVYIDEPKPSPRRVEGCLLAFAGKRRPTFDSDNDSDEDYSIMRRDLDSSREDILASSEADAESSEEPISFSFAKPKYVGAF